jgi:pyruvate formate lyase activating enzyme
MSQQPATGPPPGAAARLRDDYGWVHSWDVSVGVDGPGSRFVLFTAGCPLRCLYCENPDTWTARGGRLTYLPDVMKQVRRYRPALLAAGGGVTLSGGEPLDQPVFAGGFLRACRELGLHTALDTSGYLGHRASDELLNDVSLVLLDIKSFDPATYLRVTGRDVRPTLTFAERLAELARPVRIRFVLVPGLTDDPANVEGVARFAAGLPNVDQVDVLAYHRLGVAKYAALNIAYPLADTPEPDEKQLQAARQRFAEHGLNVT